MGSKMKQRDVANQKASQATLSVNERILKECHNLYTDPDNGLIEVSKSGAGLNSVSLKFFWFYYERQHKVTCPCQLIHKWKIDV